MALEPYQLAVNTRLTIGGSEGVLGLGHGDVLCVKREDGTVDWYTNDYVRTEGEVTRSEAEQNATLSSEQTISQLQAEIDRLKAAETPPPGPAAASTVPGAGVAPGTVTGTDTTGTTTTETTGAPGDSGRANP